MLEAKFTLGQVVACKQAARGAIYRGIVEQVKFDELGEQWVYLVRFKKAHYWYIEKLLSVPTQRSESWPFEKT
jgi:hypothetical protein